MCDGYSHCLDHSDEIDCNTITPTDNETFNCEDNKTIIPISHVNDFIPDCPGLRPNDELKTLSERKQLLKLSTCQSLETFCTKSDEIPCVAGHSRCFPFNKICVYDLDDNGNLLYCRDGSHLKGCTKFVCLEMFKCPGKY